jgi:hypothetical protein
MVEHRFIFWKVGSIREAVGGIVRVVEGRETDESLALLKHWRITAYDALRENTDDSALQKFSIEDEFTDNPDALKNTLSTVRAEYQRVVQQHQQEGWQTVRQEQEEANYPRWGFTVLEREL